ncbi:pentapeptide repeat-containing protein, partial [Phenylobacterium aquaticum]
MRSQPLSPKAVTVEAAEFEAMVRSHEGFLAGQPGSMRALPRYVIAHRMRCEGRRLNEADFTGADLTGSIFIGGDLTRAAFYCATLAKCDFRNARLLRADLRGASFAGARLGGAMLDEADLRAAT